MAWPRASQEPRQVRLALIVPIEDVLHLGMWRCPFHAMVRPGRTIALTIVLMQMVRARRTMTDKRCCYDAYVAILARMGSAPTRTICLFGGQIENRCSCGDGRANGPRRFPTSVPLHIPRGIILGRHQKEPIHLGL